MPLETLAVARAATQLTYTLAVTGFLPSMGSRSPHQAPPLTPNIGLSVTPAATPDPSRAFAAVPCEVPPFQEAETLEGPALTNSPLWFLRSAVTMSLNAFPLCFNPYFVIKIICMCIPAFLWGASWWFTTPGWNLCFSHPAPLIAIVFVLNYLSGLHLTSGTPPRKQTLQKAGRQESRQAEQPAN